MAQTLTFEQDISEAVLNITRAIGMTVRRASHRLILDDPTVREAAEINTDVPNTANLDESAAVHFYQSIIPLKGMFANDPAWDDLPAFLESYWRTEDPAAETD